MRPPRSSGFLPGAGKLAGLAALIRAARQFFQSESTVYQDPVSLAKQSASTIRINRAYQKVRAERTAQLRMELEARQQAARAMQ